jgi:hypothetical protein
MDIACDLNFYFPSGCRVSGHMIVPMDDGTEANFGAGDVGVIPPGHDAWTVGDEPFVAVDFQGGAAYAKLQP